MATDKEETFVATETPAPKKTAHEPQPKLTKMERNGVVVHVAEMDVVGFHHAGYKEI